MNILRTNKFNKAFKKLHKAQKIELIEAVKKIGKNPTIGNLKIQDLNDIRVYKFKMNKQLTLLAYNYDENNSIITLIALASHENFYTKLKR
ncbi:MAG: type II toxin-antitoxin system RelE/ParE family toxin [Alphaproteobacteria bacterium]|nr:type II toxin-antitoxin system RelE/ParE family toxin [Alphaproteobacteria bacterium]